MNSGAFAPSLAASTVQTPALLYSRKRFIAAAPGPLATYTIPFITATSLTAPFNVMPATAVHVSLPRITYSVPLAPVAGVEGQLPCSVSSVAVLLVILRAWPFIAPLVTCATHPAHSSVTQALVVSTIFPAACVPVHTPRSPLRSTCVVEARYSWRWYSKKKRLMSSLPVCDPPWMLLVTRMKSAGLSPATPFQVVPSVDW